jgi:hypothetical protein
MKGDLGRKPKALTALVRNCVNMFGSYNVGLVCTNHTYASQDMFDPDDKISGGQGFIYASSIVVAMKKMKLKEDEDGNKVSEVNGIRAGCKVMKTRYAKPFEGVQVKIPYTTGMSPYSGLTDLIEKKGLLKKEGNSLVFTTSAGEVVASEIWGELKRFVNTVDRAEAAETVVQILMDNDSDVDDIRNAFKGDSDIKRALTAYLDNDKDYGDEEDAEEDEYFDDFDDKDWED